MQICSLARQHLNIAVGQVLWKYDHYDLIKDNLIFNDLLKSKKIQLMFSHHVKGGFRACLLNEFINVE